jgi:hypothetical protein
METAFFLIFCGAAALVALMTGGYIVEVIRLLAKLRKSHSEAFRDLGEPSLFYNNSISHGMRVVRFLLERDYLELHDPALNRVAGACRALFIGAMTMFAVAMLALVAYWIRRPA